VVELTEAAEPAPPQIPAWLQATVADVQAVDIEAPIGGSAEADCGAFSDIYGKAAKDLEQANGGSNSPEIPIYRMLSALTQMYFKPKERQEPFGPMMVLADGRRTSAPSDFRGHIDTLAHLADKAINPVLKARLADLCWLLDRKRAAQGFAAIAAYVEVVRGMNAGGLKHRFLGERGALHHDSRDALLRALSIGHALGKDKPETVAARDLTKQLRKKCLTEATVVEVHRFSSLDLDYDISDTEEVGKDIESVIAANKNDENRHTIVDLWRLAARAYGYAKKEDDRNRCLSEAAEALVAQAEASKGSAMLSSHFLAQAISQLGRIPGKRERRTELRHKLVVVQEAALEELSTFSHEINLSDIAKEVQEKIAKGNLLDKLLCFAHVAHSPNPKALRDEAIASIQKHPLASIFGTSHMDNEGKVTHRTSGGGIGSDGEEDAILNQITSSEGIRRQIVAFGSVEAGRIAINAEHYISHDVMGTLLHHSQFVPDDLLETFSRGFTRFFQGDFVSAIYILTPLLENSLRHVLKSYGHDVTIFDDVTQTQKDRTISALYEQMRTELDGIFGAAITSDIERLFLQKPGPHLRHALSHGLFSDSTPFGPDSIYGCWLIFHLCMLPLIPHRKELAEWLRGTQLVPEVAKLASGEDSDR
jgi:hypothetical protein